MKLQDQVCTLEQAKKLKELGVEYEDAFWLYIKSNSVSDENYFLADITSAEKIGYLKSYPAFTVAELGVMLPVGFISFKVMAGKEFSCCKLKENYPEIDFSFTSKFNTTEAGARAETLIYILERKLIAVEEVNERL